MFDGSLNHFCGIGSKARSASDEVQTVLMPILMAPQISFLAPRGKGVGQFDDFFNDLLGIGNTMYSAPGELQTMMMLVLMALQICYLASGARVMVCFVAP